jgi:hypothetical protein
MVDSQDEVPVEEGWRFHNFPTERAAVRTDRLCLTSAVRFIPTRVCESETGTREFAGKQRTQSLPGGGGISMHVHVMVQTARTADW